MAEPRSYRDLSDFAAMCDLLASGCAAPEHVARGAHYVHPGDLSWWLFYLLLDSDPFASVHLWYEREASDDRLAAWALLAPDGGTWDVFVRPELLASEVAAACNAWAERRARQIAAARGTGTIRRMWVAEDDERLPELLARLGYAPRAYDILFERALGDPVPAAPLPGGFACREMRGEPDVVSRAEAAYAAFGNTMAWDTYVDRYRRFRGSPVYAEARDRVVVAPDGRVAAFCVVWTDETTATGHFEPVGVHPAYHRRGLGAAIVTDGLRALRAMGMRRATVCTPETNAAARHLYASAGFAPLRRLVTFARIVRPGAA